MVDQMADEIDGIMEFLTEYMSTGEFDKVDNILESVDVTTMPTELLLTYLTSTFLIRDHIEYSKFYDRVATFLASKYPDRWEGMIHGLWPICKSRIPL